jgi:DNA-binding PadR family transcriptional regulator
MDEEELDETLKSLLMKGLISVSYNENLEAIFAVTPKGIAVAKAHQ